MRRSLLLGNLGSAVVAASLLLILSTGYVSSNSSLASKEDEAARWLSSYRQKAKQLCLVNIQATWTYLINITDYNEEQATLTYQNYKDFDSWASEQAKKMRWRSFKNPSLRAELKAIEEGETAADSLSDSETEELAEFETSLISNHALAKICPYTAPGQQPPKEKDCTLKLDSDIAKILKNSSDYDELAYLWKAFRDKTGKPMKEKWIRQSDLLIKQAESRNEDLVATMLKAYTKASPDFERDLEKLWKQILPLYQQVHAYVRSKLMKKYPGKIMRDGPIPANIVGDMDALYILIEGMEPYPDRAKFDVTEKMRQKNMTVVEMFKLAEDFFLSLDLKPMTPEFWNYSVFERIEDGREMDCWPATLQACGTDYVRIKMCAEVSMMDLMTAHHEMGHAEYMLQYKNLPMYQQEGANPGFHEAVGDTVSLSAFSAKHLYRIGLLDQAKLDYEDTINLLMKMAFSRIAPLPMMYFVDIFRFGVYRGKYDKTKLNDEWWKLYYNYGGYCPPVRRTNDDFDPAAKWHVSAGLPFICYFVAQMLQFQFYEGLCNAAGHKGPLHECDFYGSKRAGAQLGRMLRQGSSLPWPEALRAITGGKSSKLDAGPLLRYFEPLHDWLKKYNSKNYVGWKSADTNVCPSATGTLASHVDDFISTQLSFFRQQHFSFK